MRDAAAIRAEAATVRGARVRSVGAFRGEVLGRIAVPTGWDAARFLVEQSKGDASDPSIVALARSFARQATSDGELARDLHAYVRDSVRFVPDADPETGERAEVFQSAAYTLLTRHAGDCDDSARALYALAIAAGLRARFGFLSVQNEPRHVFAQIWSGGAWHDAETTIAAQYGEHPLDALRRLGIRGRADMSGDVATLGGAQAADPATGERAPPSPTSSGRSLTRLGVAIAVVAVGVAVAYGYEVGG